MFLLCSQRNLSFQNEIWSGFSSVHEIESTRMDQGLIELPKLATGKPLEKIGRSTVNLLCWDIERHSFFIAVERRWVIEWIGLCMNIDFAMISLMELLILRYIYT